MPSKLFRKPPTEQFFLQIMESMKISYQKWFSKDEISLDGQETWLPELASYYLECKANRFIYSRFDKNRCITVLRHLAPLFDVELQSQEKVQNGKKATLYLLKPAQFQDLSGSNGEVIVDFT